MPLVRVSNGGSKIQSGQVTAAAITSGGGTTSNTIIFDTPFADTSYKAFVTCTNDTWRGYFVTNKTTTSMTLRTQSINRDTTTPKFNWCAYTE